MRALEFVSRMSVQIECKVFARGVAGHTLPANYTCDHLPQAPARAAHATRHIRAT